MHKDDTASIFAEYYADRPLVDRFETDRARAVDVIIPIIHTNEMWRTNLLSIYREIPVNRLILGDGGCTDDSLEVAAKYPRVEVLDHRSFTSLGFSIRHLIEATSTEWFVYLHSDVYLPPGWFDAMAAHRGDFDWFECNQRITVMADYLFDTTRINRSYSGSQMGRKAAFDKVTPLIDDDYLYRNEDIIFARLLQRTGGRYGKVASTHHFHQVMYKPSRWHRAIKRVAIEPEIARDEDIRANQTYAKGVIKYLNVGEATPDVIESVQMAIVRLVELGATTEDEFRSWVAETSSSWSRYLYPLTEDPACLATELGLPTLVLRAGSASERAWLAARIHAFADIYLAKGMIGAFVLIARKAARKLYSLLVAS